MIEKNVLLFWDSVPVPEYYAETLDAMSQVLPSFNIVSLNDQSAVEFLRREYDDRYAEGFLACRFPSMRSDLIRLAWIYRHGGLYVDWRFRPRPKAPSLFGERPEKLICFDQVFFGGHTVCNGLFLAPAGSDVLRGLKDKAFQHVWDRSKGSVAWLTGPQLFTYHLKDLGAREDVLIYKREFMMEHFFEDVSVGEHTFTHQHWFVREAREPTFYD